MATFISPGFFLNLAFPCYSHLTRSPKEKEEKKNEK
jgi:hypothetical protein